MEGRTPLEVLQGCSVFGAKKLLDFPTLIIEDHLDLIREHTDWLLLLARTDDLLEGQDLQNLDQKIIINLNSDFDFFDNQNAQNVLTYYQLFTIKKQKSKEKTLTVF